jgi:nitrite reductase/ring-hydroxylating ferredoxin subunit
MLDEASCPFRHDRTSLAAGQLEAKLVTCRSHGWRFDVTIGSTITSPGHGVATYATRVGGGKILIAVA